MDFARTRLAPSPTGALHLGHARTFLVNWWLARRAGARILMRMDDLDLQRRKDESVQQAYDDLRWLGMDWDAYKTQDAQLETQNEVVQSQRAGLYAEALQELWGRGVIFPCTCTRADIAGAASAPHEGEATPRYAGTCRHHADMRGKHPRAAEALAQVQQAAGKPACWRMRVEPGVVAVSDAVFGAQQIDVAAEVGDFPLTRFDGTPAYQLACVVDDHAMGIDCVVRGDDLLSSTPRQMLVYRALDWRPPQFAHVPLVIGADGKRLAKRHGESRIAQFRAAGVAAERIVGWVAWRSGLIDEPRLLRAGDGVDLFELSKVPRQRIVLGAADFAWLNG